MNKFHFKITFSDVDEKKKDKFVSYAHLSYIINIDKRSEFFKILRFPK